MPGLSPAHFGQAMPPNAETPEQDRTTSAFQTEARTVVRSMRGAFSDLLSQAGADVQDPASISDRIGLTKTLAWKVSKLVQTEDPSVAISHMPGASGIKLLLKGAERAGVSPPQVQIARDAVEEFERLIAVHCGDRATLDMMSGELGDAGREQRDEQHRRMLFQGASYVWGAQARVIHKLGVVAQSPNPGMLEFASVSSLIDFRRLRPDVSWTMAARHSRNDDDSTMATRANESIDPRFNRPDDCPLMADFCSQPLPQLMRTVNRHGVTFDLMPGPIGKTGVLTCVVGAIQRDIPFARTEANEWGEHQASCDLPAELMIVDLYIDERLTFAMEPEVRLVSELGGHASRAQGNRVYLPLNERLQDLGVGPRAPATPEIPRYPELLGAIYDRTGWDPRRFRGFRHRMVYPACPTSLLLRYRLPDAP